MGFDILQIVKSKKSRDRKISESRRTTEERIEREIVRRSIEEGVRRRERGGKSKGREESRIPIAPPFKFPSLRVLSAASSLRIKSLALGSKCDGNEILPPKILL